eukprot:scaffold13403_cov40-Cyclotella_meneghiniana.AAC.3
MSHGWRGSQGSLFTFQSVRTCFDCESGLDCAYLFVFGMTNAENSLVGSIEVKNECSKDLERLGSPSVVHSDCTSKTRNTGLLSKEYSFQSYKHPVRHPWSTKLKIVAVGRSK